MLDKKSLEKFKKLWKERFDEDLSDEEALEAANRLMKIARVVSKNPIDQTEEDKGRDGWNVGNQSKNKDG